ncbi:MAG: hypothetical protein ACE5HS_20605 [bacterium]
MNRIKLLLLTMTLIALFASCQTTTTGKRIRQAKKSETRLQHYQFAHKLLPRLFFSDPANMKIVLDLGGLDFIKSIWDKFGSEFGDTERIGSENLDLIVRNPQDKVFIYVIKFPPPKDLAEAYFSAMVFDGENQSYMTLEYSYFFTGTVLGAWTKDGSHLNYGSGPNPTVGEFVEAILELLR